MQCGWVCSLFEKYACSSAAIRETLARFSSAGRIANQLINQLYGGLV